MKVVTYLIGIRGALNGPNQRDENMILLGDFPGARRMVMALHTPKLAKM
jgi:hypothetical protein